MSKLEKSTFFTIVKVTLADISSIPLRSGNTAICYSVKVLYSACP
jgi:hypothetical protein